MVYTGGSAVLQRHGDAVGIYPAHLHVIHGQARLSWQASSELYFLGALTCLAAHAPQLRPELSDAVRRLSISITQGRLAAVTGGTTLPCLDWGPPFWCTVHCLLTLRWRTSGLAPLQR